MHAHSITGNYPWCHRRICRKCEGVKVCWCLIFLCVNSWSHGLRTANALKPCRIPDTATYRQSGSSLFRVNFCSCMRVVDSFKGKLLNMKIAKRFTNRQEKLWLVATSYKGYFCFIVSFPFNELPSYFLSYWFSFIRSTAATPIYR